MDYAQYLRERITSLRLEQNISEYRLSLEIGKCKTYIQTISSGRSLPSFEVFFNLCDYFEITPEEFFTKSAATRQQRRIQHKLEQLSAEDLNLIELMLNRLTDDNTGEDAQ